MIEERSSIEVRCKSMFHLDSLKRGVRGFTSRVVVCSLTTAAYDRWTRGDARGGACLPRAAPDAHAQSIGGRTLLRLGVHR